MPDRRISLFDDDRGVSEALGYVFVFSLITVTIGAVYAGGLGGLNNARQVESVNNAERAFDVLVDNVRDITERGVRSRATEIEVSNAELRVGDPVEINVSASPNGGGTPLPSYTNTSKPLVYDPSETDAQVVLSSGALIREQSDGSIMRQGPQFLITKQRTVIPIVRFTTEESGVAGSTTVLVRKFSDEEARDLVGERTTGTYDVTINVTSPRRDAWRSYLEEEGMSCSFQPPTSVECDLNDVERVYVVVIEIEVEFS